MFNPVIGKCLCFVGNPPEGSRALRRERIFPPRTATFLWDTLLGIYVGNFFQYVSQGLTAVSALPVITTVGSRKPTRRQQCKVSRPQIVFSSLSLSLSPLICLSFQVVRVGVFGTNCSTGNSSSVGHFCHTSDRSSTYHL